MRIAQVPTLSAPVSQESSGSIEAWTWLLTRELVKLGHDVSVFATADSTVPDGSRLRVTQPGAYAQNGAIDDWHLAEWLNISRAVEHSGEFDVIHSHAYLWSLPLSRISRAPLVHTTHIVPDDNTAKLWAQYPDATVTAISGNQWKSYPKLTPAAVIHHGVDVAQFTFNAVPKDYLCYLGRFVAGKGPRQAIAIARKLGLRLIMAGPRSNYFREQVEPLIDGGLIQYAGFVRGADRDRLLGGARALLYPIQYPESFGLVLVETMLCGTPVAALNVGAVSEVVSEGITGATADTLEELPAAVSRAMDLDRRKVREAAELTFSASRMARLYAGVYERLVHKRP